MSQEVAILAILAILATFHPPPAAAAGPNSSEVPIMPSRADGSPDRYPGWRCGSLALPTLAAAPLAGAPPVVRFNDPQTGVRQFSFVPYDPSFTGGVRVAVADV